MGFMSSIINVLNSVSGWFYQIYLDIYGWVYPFWLVAGFFYQLCLLFNKMAWAFYDFSSWVSDVQGKVAKILSQADILSLLRTWLSYAENAWSWVVNAWQNVTAIINTWWSSTSQVVRVWVNEAKQYAASLAMTANTWLASLQSAWDNFKGKIPAIDQVISWWGNWSGNVLTFVNTWWNTRLLDIQELINSAFIARQSFWEGWQDWRGKVTEFFTDPVEFIWQRFADWFLGAEG